MVLNINEIIYYGRSYRSTEEKTEPFWWFCVNDYQVYSTEKLICDYAFHSSDEIMRSEVYIPMFETNIIALEKEYIRCFFPQAEKDILSISRNYDNDYDTAFKIFIDVNFQISSWGDFEDSRLIKDAIDWCIAHNIPYCCNK